MRCWSKTNSCTLADVYDKSTLSEVFTGKVVLPICHSLANSWVSNSQAGRTHITSRAQVLLAIQIKRTKPLYTRNQNVNAKQFGTQNGKKTWLTKDQTHLQLIHLVGPWCFHQCWLSTPQRRRSVWPELFLCFRRYCRMLLPLPKLAQIQHTQN